MEPVHLSPEGRDRRHRAAGERDVRRRRRRRRGGRHRLRARRRRPAGSPPRCSRRATGRPAPAAAPASSSTAACATWSSWNSGWYARRSRERHLMLTRLCPHLVQPVSFVYPLRHRVWERVYAGSGVLLYDTLLTARQPSPAPRRAAPPPPPPLPPQGAGARPGAAQGRARSGRCSTTTRRSTTPVTP